MTARTNEASAKVRELCDKILAGIPLGLDVELSLDDLAALYHKVSQQAGTEQRVDIVLQNKRAFVQFTSRPPGNARVYVVSEQRLFCQDFTRIIANPVFHGDVLSCSARERFAEDRNNILIAGSGGIIFSILLFVLGNSAAPDYVSYLADPDTFPSVARVVDAITGTNELLLTSATLFLSIFLIFTVAQSSKLQEDSRLFDSGLLHKFERDDRLVAMVALLSLLLSVANVIVLGLPFPWEIANWSVANYAITLNKLSLISPLMTGLTVSALIFCFLSLLYYLKRMMLITNRDMSEKVLAKAEREHQPGDSHTAGG